MGNDLVKIGEDRQSFESPLIVVRCEDCCGVQLKHDVNPAILFKNYLYSTPPNLDGHFKKYARDVSSFLGLKKGEAVVEIGGNNGMLCSHFKKLGYDAINVDPGLEVAKLSLDKRIKTYHSFFDKQIAKKIEWADTGKVKLICANNVFAHTNLDVVMEGVLELLDNDGTLVIQNAYLPNTLDQNDIGQFYAEHVAYHLLYPLETYFAQYDLNLYHVEFNDMQFGSFRAFVGKRVDDATIQNALKKEKKYLKMSSYTDFWKRLNKWKDRLERLLYNLDGSMSLYGVTAKVALLIKFIGFHYFDYAIDDSEFKWERKVPGTDIEIYPSKQLKNHPTKICVIGAYNMSNYIVQKNQYYEGLWIDPLKLQIY